MATGNFKPNPNTKNIYAYCMMRDYINDLKQRREEDGETYDEEAPINYDDFNFWCQNEALFIESDIIDRLTEKFGSLNVWKPDDKRASDREASILCAVETTFDFAGNGWPIQLQVTTRPGYYEGAQIDIELRSICWDTFSDIDDRPEDSYLHYLLTNDRGHGEGLATMLVPKMQKRIDAVLSDFIDQVDEVLADIATHKLGITHRFSNGETWYAEVA